MTRWELKDLAAPLPGIKLLSTDVFDTLLLRNGKSERWRCVAGERRFSAHLARNGREVAADHLAEVRLEAQRLAFRALSVAGDQGEARLEDIVARQASLLGLSPHDAEARLAIELDVEKTALAPNRMLAELLRRQASAGTRIVAISDTTLRSAEVLALIEHFHGPGLVERVYTSADEGRTKREGSLFDVVAAAEGVLPVDMLHIGDDPLADGKMPARRGLQVCLAPRAKARRHLSRGHGGLTELGRRRRRRLRAERAVAPSPQDATSFGRMVLGPIVAQFCMLIWLYGEEARRHDRTALLFCARGGIGIREAFERFMARVQTDAGWRDDVIRENLMVSRLVAARAALAARSPLVLDELGREFRGGSYLDVAQALGGRTYQLPQEWNEVFQPARWFEMLASDAARELAADIDRQHDLFARHFRSVIGDAERVILCDTGLYGSTQRLLGAGFPDLSIETIQFARSNYKKLPEDHFPRVVGLLVERNGYSPFDIESCVLRYWQLIESLFEPAIPSARSFELNDAGEVVGNCGPIAFGAIDAAAGNPLLSGVLHYIDDLPTGGAGADVLEDAEPAWRSLKRAITTPTEADLKCLEVGLRSVDFGREAKLRVIDPGASRGFSDRLKSIRMQLWREGAIVREFPVLKSVLLPMIEAVQAVRGLQLRAPR